MAEYGGTEPDTATHYVTTDHLGSTRVVTDRNKAIVMCRDYLPFGDELIASSQNGRNGISCYGADETTHKFTGKERDSESRLDNFGARYFSWASGRFNSPDPFFMSTQRRTDPQQWNMYAYVRNNPLGFLDPDGKELRPVYVHVTGGQQDIRYIDARLVPRLQRFAEASLGRGLSFTFNELFRTPEHHEGIVTPFTKNTTGTSPHLAGLAVDINVATSLTPGFLASLPDLNAAAAVKGSELSPLSNQMDDPGHYQANDLITRDANGKVDHAFMELIKENQASFTELEQLRQTNPTEFGNRVVQIDTYIPPQRERACREEGTCEP